MVETRRSKMQRGKDRGYPRSEAAVTSSSQEVEGNELQAGCGLSDMPQEVIEQILDWVTPLELLHIRTLNRYLRSIVSQYRAQRSSEPWLLMNVNAPCRVSLAGKGKWKKAGQCESCWALEPETLRWKELSLPFIPEAPGKDGRDREAAVKVDSVGSSGLVVVWRSPQSIFMVGNLMTQKWQKVAANPNHKSGEGWRKERYFATHLELDERKQPLKLVHFSSRENSGSKACYAHTYCFSSKKWDEDFIITGVPEIRIPSLSIAWYSSHLTRVHETVCAQNGIVFILMSFSSLRRYLVLSYSVALGQFAIAVPWSEIPAAEFTCSWKHVVLTFNSDEEFQDCGLVESEKPDECQQKHDFAGASAGHPAVRMNGLVRGLQLLVAQEAMWKDGRGSEIQVLKHDPESWTWKVAVRESSVSAKASKRAQLQRVVCGFCKELTRKVSAVSFQMARSGNRSVFVAAYNDYCTQIGSYNLDTGLLRRVQTPLLPREFHCEKEAAPFWSKFTMQPFFPDLNDSESF